MTEEVIVLQPGDERAQKVARAISSQTANDILHILQEGPKTASDLTGVLNLPMGTVKYHIENLLEAGLLEVSETRYSVKGREVKVYSLKDQLLIVAPGHKNIRSILLRYASLFVVLVFATFGFYILQPLMFAIGVDRSVTLQGEEAQLAEKANGGAIVHSAPPAPTADYWAVSGSHDAVIAFFIGGCLVIILLLIYEAYLWKKK